MISCYVIVTIGRYNFNTSEMLKRVLFVLVLIVAGGQLKAQEKRVNVSLLGSVNEIISRPDSTQSAEAVIREEKGAVFYIKEFFEPGSAVKLKRAFDCFSFVYNNDVYFNLKYSKDMQEQKAFIKLDRIGRYCMAFLYDNQVSPSGGPGISIGGGLGGGIGVGLGGVSLSRAMQGSKHWTDQYGKKRRILLVDTKSSGSQGFYLTHKLLNDLLEQNERARNSKELSFERVVDFMEGLK